MAEPGIPAAQAGLDRHQQQGAVAAPGSGAGVGGSRQGLDFVAIQEVHRPTGAALARHGRDALRQSRMQRLVQGDVAEEGADRRQARVAGPCAVAALRLEMVREGPDEGGVQLAHGQVDRRFLQLPLGVADQQAERVAVACDGMRAGPELLPEAVGEERRQQPGEVGGGLDEGPLRAVRSSRRAASRSSSGSAVRYQ